MKTSNSSNWALMLSKTVLTVVFSLCFFCLSAEEYKVTIKAGKLKSALKGKEDVTKLTISGKMNGSDFLYIRELSTLQELDLTNVSIVSGGKAYLEKKLSQRERMDFRDNLRNKDALSTLILLGKSGFSENKKYKVTEADVLPDFVFLGKSNLRKIILPNQLVKVGRNALVTNNPNLVVQFTSQKPPRIEAQYINNGTEEEEKSISNTNDVDNILGSVSSNEMAKYFGIKSSKKEKSSQVCAKIIVPGNSFHAYKAELNEHMYKSLLKDHAPSEYTISLDTKRLGRELEGGYNFVSRLTLSGNMHIDDLKVLSQLPNLQYLDMRNVTVEDTQFINWLQTNSTKEIVDLLVDISKYSKSSGLISTNDTISYYTILRNVISVDTNFLNLIEEKKVLLTSLSDLQKEKTDLPEKREKAKEQAAQKVLLYGLLGMSDEVLDKQYEHYEISTTDYMSNKIFGDALKEELEKELQKADLSDPNVYARISKEIDNGINTYNRKIKQLETKMQPTENSLRKQLDDFYNKVSTGSIIPSKTFVELFFLNQVILPENTVIIGDHAFLNCAESLEVEVNANAKQLGIMSD